MKTKVFFLSEFINVFDVKPTFLLPLFVNNGFNYFQKIESDQIISFIKADLDLFADSPRIKIKNKNNYIVGDDAIYAIDSIDGNCIYGNRKTIKAYLDDHMNYYRNYPSFSEYISLFFESESKSTMEIPLPEHPHTPTVQRTLQKQDWILLFLSNMRGKMREFISGNFTIVSNMPALAMRGVSTVSEKQDGNNNSIAVTVKEEENFFEFEVNTPTTVNFIIPIIIAAGHDCELFLCHETEGEKGPYPLRSRTIDGKSIGGRTEVLSVGKYVGVVLEMKE